MSKKKSKQKDIEQEVVKETESTQEQPVDNNKDEAVEVKVEDLLQQEKDKFLRLFAEFENYKKRTTKERLELFKTASKDLMSALLPVLDDYERALSEIKKAEDDELFKGVELIYSKFKSVLENKGLTLIEVEAGEVFDAEIHQAITQIPAPSDDLKGKIIDVTEKGYKIGETVLRFPKVVVGQ